MAANTKKTLEEEFKNASADLKNQYDAHRAAYNQNNKGLSQSEFDAQKSAYQNATAAPASSPAKTYEDVNKQDAKTRLAESLDYSYGKKIDSSNEAYDKAISQQSRALLSRGMQRSSAGMSSIGNLQNEKIKAQSDIEDAKIADYQNRLSEAESKDTENEWRQKEYDLKKEQFGSSQDLEYAKLALQRELSQAELAQNQSQFDTNTQLNYDTLAQNKELEEKRLEQNQGQFDVTNQYNYDVLAQNKDIADRQMDTEADQFEKNLQFSYDQLAQNRELEEKRLDQSQNQFDSTQDYNYAALAQNRELTEKQMDTSSDQFEKNLQFSYDQLSQNKELELARMAQQLQISNAELEQSRFLTLEQLAQQKDLTMAQLAQQLGISEAELAQNRELTLEQLAQQKELSYAQLNQNAEQFNKNLQFSYDQLAQQLKISTAELKQNENLTLKQLAQTKQLTEKQLAQQLKMSEAELKQNKDLTLKQLAQQKELSLKQMEQGDSQFAIEQGFKEKQLEAQTEQWKQEFDYNKKSDEQKLAFNYVTSILANGNDPSDELLKQAGLSRKDANAMKAKVSSGSGGTKNTTTTPDKSKAEYVGDSEILNAINGTGLVSGKMNYSNVKEIEDEKSKKQIKTGTTATRSITMN